MSRFAIGVLPQAEAEVRYASENPRSLTLLPFDRIVAVDATNLPIDKGAAEPRTARLRWYELYEHGDISLEGLRRKAPLIAAAVEKRAGLKPRP